MYPENDGFTIGYSILQIAFGRKSFAESFSDLWRAAHYYRREIVFSVMEAVEPASIFHKAAGGGFIKAVGELHFVYSPTAWTMMTVSSDNATSSIGFRRSRILLGERTSLTKGRDTTARFIGW